MKNECPAIKNLSWKIDKTKRNEKYEKLTYVITIDQSREQVNKTECIIDNKTHK